MKCDQLWWWSPHFVVVAGVDFVEIRLMVHE